MIKKVLTRKEAMDVLQFILESRFGKYQSYQILAIKSGYSNIVLREKLRDLGYGVIKIYDEEENNDTE